MWGVPSSPSSGVHINCLIYSGFGFLIRTISFSSGLLSVIDQQVLNVVICLFVCLFYCVNKRDPFCRPGRHLPPSASCLGLCLLLRKILFNTREDFESGHGARHVPPSATSSLTTMLVARSAQRGRPKGRLP